MYSLQKAYGVGVSMGSVWGDVDLSTLAVKQIYAQYREMYLVLTNPLIADPVNVNLADLKDEFINYDGTLVDLFTEIGDRALPTVTAIPKYKTKWAVFGDAYSQGFKVEINEPGRVPDNNGKHDNKTEVTITRPRLNARYMYEHCLVSLNGYFYPTDYDANNLYILNGGKSLLRSRRNQIGILSFQDVAKIEQLPVTKDMISKMGVDGKYANEVVFSIDPKYQNKSVILCLAGHLVFPNEHNFKKIADNDWLLSMSDLPIIERYFESKNYIDYSSLGLTVFPDNPNKINVEEFLSDEVLEKYITHEQSFFIVVDTPNLIRNHNYIRGSKLPGMFTAYEEPKSLLFVGRGRTAEYWKTYEDGQWAVNVVNSYMPNRTFDSVNEKHREINAGTDTPHRLYYDSRAFFLDLGVDVLETP